VGRTQIERSHSDKSGFATATAIMLCVGLAVVSVALVDLGHSAVRRTEEEVQRENERLALRSAISEVAAALVNSSEAGLGSFTKQYGELRVEVTATNELAKADANQATEAQLVKAFEPLVNIDAAKMAANLVSARTAAGAADMPLDDLLARLDLPSEVKTCLRETLTVHAASVDPFAIAGATPVAKGGGIVNLRARIVAGRPLNLTREEIVVITGDFQTPLLVIDQRTFRSSLITECFDEAA
jgi:hypothetical protein